MANIWVYTGGFRNVVHSCEDGVSTCEVAHVCLEVVSQLQNTLQNFASGFHFAAHFAAAKWALGCQIFAAHFVAAKFRTAWCGCLQTTITSSFQLQIMHRLKHWIFDFPSFETTYGIHQLSSRKCSKSVQQWLSSWILHVRFLSLLSLLAFMICLWQRTIKLQSLGSSC